MPKPTFLKLPDDKRERFVQAAVREFALKPYDLASVTRVVADLGIAKGSVYQYFADKFDLFQWLVEESSRRKMVTLGTSVVPMGGFWDQLRSMHVTGLRFRHSHPLWSQLAVRMLEPSKEPRLEALRHQREAATKAYMLQMFANAQKLGVVRDDVDVQTAAHLAQGLLGQGLTDAFLARKGLDTHTLLNDPNRADDLTAEDVDATVDLAIGILMAGLALNTGPLTSR